MHRQSGDYCGCYLCASWITWASGVTDDEQEEIIAKVEQLIDKVTGTHWGCAPAFDIKLNGNDKNRLFIPVHDDIQNVSNIFINCVELDSSWWAFDVNSVFLDPCIGDSMWGRNAIQDGDFYSWKVAAPTTDLYYWIETLAPAPATSTINRDTAQVQVGNYCVRMDIDALNSQAQIRQRVSLLRNRNYKLFFKYMNDAFAMRGRFMLYNADRNESLLRDGTWTTGQVYVSLPTSGGTTIPYATTWIDYSLPFKSHTDFATYTLFLENEMAWEVDFDGGQNEPAIGDTVSTPTDPNFIIVDYSVTEGAWATGDAAGKLWIRKPGVTTCLWAVDQNITNNTQGNTLAGGAGLGVVTVTQLWAANSQIYFDNVGILTAGITAIAADISAGIFPRGFNNIQVIGTHGEDPTVPEAIKQAAVILANWENATGDVAVTGLMKSEKIGDYSYTTLATSEADVLTGVSKADMLLRHYIKRKPILMAP